MNTPNLQKIEHSVNARLESSATDHTFNGLPFAAVDAADKQGAEAAIKKFLKKSGVQTTVKNVRADPNGGWQADVGVPTNSLKKFALHYSDGDSHMANDLLEETKKSQAPSVKPTTPGKKSATPGKYPEWLASMSPKHRAAYFAEHPNSKYK